jgi:hypothetical protein
MSHSQTVQLGDEDFAVEFHGSAWQEHSTLSVVDGTIELEAHSLQSPGCTIVGLIHGRLLREFPNGPFSVTFSSGQVCEVIEFALSDWAKEEPCDELNAHPQTSYRVDDARWRMKDCPVSQTDAPRYAGGGRDILEAELKLASWPGMQDWPLEASDHSRVDDFCAFYDRKTDPVVKFDTMQLALCSYDARPQLDTTHSEWFDRTLRRDFALHGHTVAYWAMLERASDDPEFGLSDPEFVFKISGLLRRIWEDSLMPIDLHWHLSE